ncbi:related to GPI anchored protein [Rhynchosporium graminicola]|uniref:Related to GPI anchored protein n=1 Tax=Rhynchosporium graminicola TaxID=2792576 RepID=A0A1E1L7H0_9HELO|nr:related to GPI anchored protein [Rhynchosporium commune]
MPISRPSLCSLNSIIAFLFITTVIVPFMVMMGQSPAPSEEHTVYSTVTGYFLQDDEATDPKGFDFVTDADLSSNSKLTQWQRFAREISRLNHDGSEKVTYKLLYLGRHGEGYHNLAETFYGTEAWDCYWSLQPGNSTSTWSDALLTPAGKAQALVAHAFWAHLITTQKIPFPETYYTSPLLRCLATASLTFSHLDLPKDRPFIPTIKENIREVIGVHTCDRRSGKSVIKSKYPDWPFEDGFAEEDPLWSAELRETDEAIDQRTLRAIEDIFSTDDHTYISLSTHSGQIASMLRVLNHRVFGLGTGQAIPVLVKAEKLPGPAPVKGDAPWMPVKTCSEPPPAAITV